MKEEIHYSQAPTGYMVCLRNDCPQADTCLRQLVEKTVPAHIPSWTIVSPRYIAMLQGPCPYYRSVEKLRFAKGFLKLLENLPHKQMRTVITQLTGYFGRRTYYRVRKGERLISPYEQKQVLYILKNCGVSDPQDFDAYVDEYNW